MIHSYARKSTHELPPFDSEGGLWEASRSRCRAGRAGECVCQPPRPPEVRYPGAWKCSTTREDTLPRFNVLKSAVFVMYAYMSSTRLVGDSAPFSFLFFSFFRVMAHCTWPSTCCIAHSSGQLGDERHSLEPGVTRWGSYSADRQKRFG